MESLLTAQLNQEGVHVYAKLRPFMKIKTDKGKEYYDIWFILEGRGGKNYRITPYINYYYSFFL